MLPLLIGGKLIDDRRRNYRGGKDYGTAEDGRVRGAVQSIAERFESGTLKGSCSAFLSSNHERR